MIDDKAIGVILRDDTLSGLPEVSIEAKESIVTKGSPVTFVLTVFPPTLKEFELDIEFMAEEVEFFATEDFLLWRAGKIFKFSPENNEMTFKTYDAPDSNSEVRLIVELFTTDQYVAQVGRNMAEVVLRRVDTIIIPTDEPRISVASSVVTSILNSPHLSNPGTERQVEFKAVKPIVSIHANKSSIVEGEVAEFYLSSNLATEASVLTVNLEVNQVGDFFHQAREQMLIQVGGPEPVPISIQTINDDYAEEDGKVEINIINDATYNITKNAGYAAVIISDALDRNAREVQLTTLTHSFLPNIVTEIGKQNTEVLSLRTQQIKSDYGQVHLNLGGQESIQGILSVSGEALNDDVNTFRNLLGDSSFSMPLGVEDNIAVPANIWGIGNYQNLSSDFFTNSEQWTGDLFTGHLGIDTFINSDTLAGLSYSRSESEIKIETDSRESIDYELNSTTINPYFSWTSSNGEANLRAMAGYGVGDIGIDQPKYDLEAFKTQSTSLVISGSKLLYSSKSMFSGDSNLNLIGESWIEHQRVFGQEGVLENLQIIAKHFNIRAEGTHQFELSNASKLNPNFSVGFRSDQNNIKSVSGLELSTGIKFDEPVGISFSGDGRILSRDGYSIDALKFESKLNIDFDNDEQGWMLEVSPIWSQVRAKLGNLRWNQNLFDSESDFYRNLNGFQLDSRISYGIGLDDDSKLMLTGDFQFNEKILGNTRLGVGLLVGKNLKVNVDGAREFNKISTDEYKFKISGRMSW